MVSHVELRKSSVIIRIVRVGLTCSEKRVRGGSTRSRIQKQSMMWDPHAKEWQYAPGNRTVPDTCFDRARVSHSHSLFCTNKNQCLPTLLVCQLSLIFLSNNNHNTIIIQLGVYFLRLLYKFHHKVLKIELLK